MTNEIYRVAAFTDGCMGGNPAGVVLNADALSEEQMLVIAKDIGYSETAFVMQSTMADFQVRFFTPVDEVDLCGHATVATFNLLRDLGVIGLGDYIQETKAGVLKLQINEQSIFMEQNTPQYYDEIQPTELEHCFKGLRVNDLCELPIQIVSTGLKDIILPIKSLDALLKLEPNSDRINKLSMKYDVVGIHAFSLETFSEGEAHSRNFAPRYGIDEESATGTANGALSCYLMKYCRDIFDGAFVIEQGYSMKKPSKILTNISVEDDRITEVYVGGSAVII